jgi:spoIIIJ-associated protein
MSETPVVDTTIQPEPKALLEEIFAKMGLDVQVGSRQVGPNTHLDVSGTDVEIARGKKGEVLDALQYLLAKMLPQSKEEAARVFIDIATFRAGREESLTELAGYLRNKVLQLKKPISVFPMGSQDRRAIHQAFTTQQEVVSQSEGEGLARRIFIFEPSMKTQKPLVPVSPVTEVAAAPSVEERLPISEQRSAVRRAVNPYLFESFDEMDKK